MIEQVDKVDDKLVRALAQLVAQLSRSAPAPRAFELEEIVADPGSVLFVALDDHGDIIGSLTLVTYRIPTGLNAVIEDVVVDSAARGAGVATALVKAGLEEADQRGARHVDLTSRPERTEANRLYSKMGFVQRETNVYRYSASTARSDEAIKAP